MSNKKNRRWLVVFALFSIIGLIIFNKVNTPKKEETVKLTTTETSNRQSNKKIAINEEKSPITEVDTSNEGQVRDTVNSFLEAYFTYETYGDNLEKYLPFFREPEQKELEKTVSEEIKHINTSGLLASDFLSASIYLSDTEKSTITALCHVERAFIGDTKEEGAEVITDIIVTLKLENKTFKIDSIKGADFSLDKEF